MFRLILFIATVCLILGPAGTAFSQIEDRPFAFNREGLLEDGFDAEEAGIFGDDSDSRFPPGFFGFRRPPFFRPFFNPFFNPFFRPPFFAPRFSPFGPDDDFFDSD